MAYVCRRKKPPLFLQSLSLTQFRNYSHQSYPFTGRVVGISGANGVGKTNLLDAIYFLCFTRSYFSRTDAASVQLGQAGFRIQGLIGGDKHQHEVVCILREQGKKEFLVDQEPVGRFSRHIGRFPVVFIAPDDIALVSEGAEERRRFLDTLLSQLDANYLQELIRYQKIIQERNSLLKALQENPGMDLGVLDVLDNQLAQSGQSIYQRRKDFLANFLPEVTHRYAFIAGKAEVPVIRYQSGLHETDFASLLRRNRSRDIAVARTLSGVHRDDLELELNGLPFRQTASQGQRKSLLFAFKLAEFSALQAAKGSPPLLLLDDIFEKLDAERMENLLHWVCKENAGQVFLTDTHQRRIQDVMTRLGVDCQYIELIA